MIKANRTEIAYVEQTLLQVEEIGLRRNAAFSVAMETYANAVVEGYPCTDADGDGTNRITQHAPCPRLAVLWVIEAEETGESLACFQNALVFNDHCFDVAGVDDYEKLLRKILSTANNDWRPRLLRTRERTGFFSAPKVQLAIEIDGSLHTLAIEGRKDFEPNLIAQLNALVPETVGAKFAWCGDGGTVMVVWLTPKEIAELSDYCGVVFDIP